MSLAQRMYHFFFTALFCFPSITLWAFPSQDPDPLAIYDRTTAIVSKKFFDPTFRGLPWVERVQKKRETISQQSTEEQLKEALNELLKELRASHTSFYSSSDQTYWALHSIFSHSLEGHPFCQIGAWFEQKGDRWFVRNVFEASPAAQAGIRAGDEVIGVDGLAFKPISSFQMPKSRCGRIRTIELRRTKREPNLHLPVTPRFESVQNALLRATRDSFKIYSVNKKRIAYFHLWAGTHEAFQQALYDRVQAIGNHQSDALILDLRDGFGGANPEYLKPFFPTSKEPAQFDKPIVAIVNEGVRSGKEWISYLLKKKRRATLLGTTTAGAFLAGSPFEIQKGKYLLYLAVLDQGPPDVTEPIEGVGISPDIFVPYVRPYSAGFDPQLEQALGIFK